MLPIRHLVEDKVVKDGILRFTVHATLAKRNA